MGSAVSFRGVNKVLGPPAGVSEDLVGSLPIFANGVVCVSRWALSPEELADVARTGCVWISIYSGPTQPPVYVGSEEAVRAVAVDFGPVWEKEG